MALPLKSLYTPLILFIIIIETTGIDSNDTSPDKNQRSGARARVVKLYPGAKQEPILCTNEGFLPDPHNCATFYRCMKSGHDRYTVFRFQCGPGTIYDPEKQVCNHPIFTKRSDCGDTLDSFDHTTNINEIQSNMYNEIPSPMGTKEPIYFPNTQQKSTMMNINPTPLAHKVNFTTESYITSTPVSYYPLGSAVHPIYTTQNLHETVVKPLSTLSPIAHPISREDMCTSDGFLGDSENCRKFYRCVANQRGGFTRYEFMCTETTVWDEVSQTCNHVWAVKKSRCRLPTNQVINLNTQFTKENLHTTEKNKTKPDKQNVINNTQQLHIVNGLEEQNTTPPNYGDRVNKNKGNKENHSHNGVQTQLPIDYSKEGSQNQIQITEASTRKTSTTVRQFYNQDIDKPVSANCTEVGFVGDYNDCRKFYRCVNDGQGGFKKYEFTCAEGTAWDSSLKTCNHIWAVKECNLQGSINSSPQTITTTTYKSTQSYYTTSTEHATPLVTESNEDNNDIGYIYSKPESTPISSSSSSTTTMMIYDSNATECKSNGFMGDDNDCKIFYRCIENGNGGFTKYAFKCSEGTLWDPQITACNHAWAVTKCGGNTVLDISKIETTTVKSTTSLTGIHSTDHLPIHSPNISSPDPEYDDNNFPGYGLSDNDIHTTSKPSITKNITTYKPSVTASTFTTESISIDDKCTKSGFMGNSKDCKRFYRCVDDGNGSYIKYEFSCGEGTLWDESIQSCNHAWAVTKCSSNTESPPLNNGVDHMYPSNTDSEIISTTVSNSLSPESTRPLTENEFCVSSGFFGDTKNCEKFYRCVDNGKGSFIRYDYVCGEGTVWDQNLKACNHRWAVKECGNTTNTTINKPNESTTEYSVIPTTSAAYEDSSVTQNISEITHSKNDSNLTCTKEGFVADPNNCKSFYRCVDDGKGGLTRYEYSCGEGTYWNQNILSCDHVAVSQSCKPGQTSITKVPQVQNEINTETTTTSRDESHQQKPIAVSVCTSEGFYADPYDCKKFYRCVNDGKGGYSIYYNDCSEGTSWDQKQQICNQESFDKCVNSTPGALQTTTNPQQGSISMTSEKYISSSMPVQQCESEGFFAVPNDCKNFIRCVSNNQGGFTKYEFACSEGTVWVQELLTCDHDTGEADCNSHTTTKPITNGDHQLTTENYVPTSLEYSPEDNLNENMSNNNKPPATASGDCSSQGYYPNENDCRSFYQCVDNGNGNYTKYDQTCGEGTAWDPDIQACNYIDQVSSCKGSVMHDINNIQTTESSGATTLSNLSSSTMTTTTSSSPHKPTTNSADFSPESDTQNKDICTGEGYFGNTQDCKKFYRCVADGKGSYTKYDFDCAEGTIWDKDVVTCNHPENVANLSCKQTPDSGTTEDLSFNGPSTSTTESYPEQNDTSKKPDNNNIKCTKAGFYGDPNNCKKFYRCVDWDGNETKFSIFHFECGEGTIWDPAVETCNHENSVYPPRDCMGMGTQATSPSLIESTTQSITSSTTKTTIAVTTESATLTTTERPEESTIQQSVESTTQPLEENTTNNPEASTTERSGEETTETSTENTSEHTEETTAPSGETTTLQSGENTTQQSGQSTTEQLGESTTEQLGESTTGQLGESTTEKILESTTKQPGESTTEKLGESTTEQLGESTTEQLGESTTEQLGESTTEQLGESTTEQLGESTTEQLGESTTEKLGESTTEQLGESTTEKLGESTTEQLGESTTEKLGESTTEQLGESTTEKLGESTTEQLTESTTERSGESTTEGTTENSTEESTENTTTVGSSTGQPTTDKNETTESETDTSTKKPTDSDCPELEDDQYLFVCPSSFRRHPKYCNLFYQCDGNEDTHDLKIAVFTCPNNTIYDAKQTKCVQESKAQEPCRGEISEKRRVKRKDNLGPTDPLVVSDNSFACTTTGYFAFEKEGDCSPGLFKCSTSKSNKLRGLVYQCPPGYLFWNVSRRCEPIYKISDCKRSLVNDWSRRWEIPVERRNVAS